MTKKNIALFALACIMPFSAFLFAAESPVREALTEPERILMMKLDDVASVFGFPESVFTVRGCEVWQDDVVFAYSDGLELFICADVVWQVRFTRGESGSVRGIRVGDSRTLSEKFLPPPSENEQLLSLYRIDGSGYPIGVQIVWNQDDDTVKEMYVFRADY